MYYLMKSLVEPYPVLVIIGTFCAWRVRRHANVRGARMAYRALWLLWILSLPIVAWMARYSLEWQYRPPQGKMQVPEKMDAIIVLGGGMIVGDDPQDVEPSIDSMNRCMHAIKLGEDNEAKFILCGGSPRLVPEAPSESEAMRDFMVKLGVSEDRIITEERSSTTWENARFATEICREREFEYVALVTQGWHLRRAIGCFHNVGLEVIPNGCCWQAHEMRIDWYRHILPSVGAVHQNQLMLREWLGIGWYRFKGRL